MAGPKHTPSRALRPITQTLAGASAVVAFTYPNGMGAADFAGCNASVIFSQSQRALFQDKGDFSLDFGASEITATVTAEFGTLAKGDTVTLYVDAGQEIYSRADDTRVMTMAPTKISFGTPATADADGAVASQAATAASGLATGINGALAASGVATFDVPRNVVAAWTGTSVLTVTGTDEFGNVVIESSASGTSFTGKKAFKTVTGISVSADVTGLTVGTGVVLGLPCFLGDADEILIEQANGTTVTNGTFVAGDGLTPTATTGDVRGTYSPFTAPNGTNSYTAIILARDPNGRGQSQYVG
jgi:hypothetical protein